METVNIEGDSTFALMLEAQARGHTMWHYEVRHLSLREGVSKPHGASGPSACSRAHARSRCSGNPEIITSSAAWPNSILAPWMWC